MINPLKELGAHIQINLGESFIAQKMVNGELEVVCKGDTLTNTLLFLRDDTNCLFEQLMDVTAIDHIERTPRFDVVYQLLSLTNNFRLRLKVQVEETDTIPSATEVFPSANWFEREVWDMYGLVFKNHPDLRRILTDYGFEGHPLRKDFPLSGYVQLRYDEKEQRIVQEPVKLMQDYRNFDFESPWEGVSDVLLPGDEKAEQQAETAE